MIKSLSHIYVCLFLIAASLQAQNFLAIRTTEEKAAIYINGEFISNKEIEYSTKIDTLAVRIVKDVYSWSAQEIKDTIIFKDNRKITRTYSFENQIVIDSHPQNVYVYEADSIVGYTPLLMNNYSSTFELNKKGYSSAILKLDGVNAPPKISLEFIGEENNGSFFSSPWFSIAVGSAIAFGSVAAYYKLKADESFDKYLITKNKEFLDQTDRYDLVSGIAFGIVQLDFAFLIYKFLTE